MHLSPIAILALGVVLLLFVVGYGLVTEVKSEIEPEVPDATGFVPGVVGLFTVSFIDEEGNKVPIAQEGLGPQAILYKGRPVSAIAGTVRLEVEKQNVDTFQYLIVVSASINDGPTRDIARWSGTTSQTVIVKSFRMPLYDGARTPPGWSQPQPLAVTPGGYGGGGSSLLGKPMPGPYKVTLYAYVKITYGNGKTVTASAKPITFNLQYTPTDGRILIKSFRMSGVPN